MKIEVLADADSVAQRAATMIAAEARTAVAARGRFIMAVSGGHTPWVMLRSLAGEEVPWEGVHVAQVDERVAPAGHRDGDVSIPAGRVRRDQALVLTDRAAAGQLGPK